MPTPTTRKSYFLNKKMIEENFTKEFNEITSNLPLFIFLP
jgi:hypothetical protein